MIYGIWTFCAALLAFIISAVTGKFLIPYLRKLHFGQTILEEGPKWHKGKQGTPTMGGIMFIVAIVVVTMISTIIYAFTGADLVNSFFADIPRECTFIFCGLGLAVANGFIGFIDDYGSVTFFACVAFMLIACVKSYLGITAMSAASAGACLGFLVWNFHPAKVFMGDTGSLFLGGLVCALAFAIDMPILLIPIGIIYIAEELSVILQVSYFKITHGKRLFKMSPIHHHFEMCGWSEVKIVGVFSAVTAVFGAIAFALAYFGA